MFSIPEQAQLIDTPTSTAWIDETGIVCAVSKRAVPQTVEEVRANLEAFKKHVGRDKICLLIDVTHTAESSREVRAFVAQEFPKMIKAIAMVSDSALGKMLANLFFNLKSQPYPARMFNDEGEARAWLSQYL